MTFSIFNVQTPGSHAPLWSEVHTSVQLSNGVFNVLLGSLTPFPVDLFDTYDDLYLRVTVDGENLSPLIHLASSAYAMKADTANHAHTANSMLNGTVTGNLLVEGRVGVGEAAPDAELHVSMTPGSIIPSQIPGLIIEDANLNSGSRMEIRVSGAGGNTSTPVFRHVPSLSNSRCDISGHACLETTIDHPMTNGDPSAILIITPNGTDSWYSDSTTPRVKYDYTEQKWKIYMRWWDLPNLQFNVLVVKN